MIAKIQGVNFQVAETGRVLERGRDFAAQYLRDEEFRSFFSGPGLVLDTDRLDWCDVCGCLVDDAFSFETRRATHVSPAEFDTCCVYCAEADRLRAEQAS